MPIRFSRPPDASLNELTEFLVKRTRPGLGSAAGVRLMVEGARVAPEKMFPHQVFTVSLEELANGSNLREKARSMSWRYVLPAGTRAIAAEVTSVANEHHFSSSNQGPFVEQTIEYLEELSRSPELEAADYEMRALVIPAIYVFALWLYAEDATLDRFVPMGPTDRRIRVRHHYDEEGLRMLLREIAIERLNMNNRP